MSGRTPRAQFLPSRVLHLCGVLALVFGAETLADTNQWKPQRNGKDLRLQDFCIFKYQGDTFIASMMKDFCNEGIALARSKDLSRWELLGTALKTRGAEDRSMVWAPHVVESKGTWFIFYTGVTTPAAGQWCQRVLVASSTVPDDPNSWQRLTNRQFIVSGKPESFFRPSHKGSIWSDRAWADCRDPMVLQKNGTWHLFYSGTDDGAGICGVATAPSILGPWTDRGAVLKVPTASIPESCFVLEDPDGGYVLVFNHAGPKGNGIKLAHSRSLLPIDGKPPFDNIEVLQDSASPGLKGWAHEFLPLRDDTLLSAYLTGYFVTFEKARFVKGPHGWSVGPSGR